MKTLSIRITPALYGVTTDSCLSREIIRSKWNLITEEVLNCESEIIYVQAYKAILMTVIETGVYKGRALKLFLQFLEHEYDNKYHKGKVIRDEEELFKEVFYCYWNIREDVLFENLQELDYQYLTEDKIPKWEEILNRWEVQRKERLEKCRKDLEIWLRQT